MADAQTPVLTDEQITRAADAADCRWLLKEYSLSLSAFARTILAAQAPAQPAEAVAAIKTWYKGAARHADLIDWGDGLDALPDGEHRVYTHPAPSQPDRAVMQQALEALARLRDRDSWRVRSLREGDDEWISAEHQCLNAIAALEKSLAP